MMSVGSRLVQEIGKVEWFLPTVHRRHDESDLGGIGSTSKVGVYLLRLMLVQRYKAVQDIVAGRGIVGSTFFKVRFLVIPSVGSNLVQLAFIVREIMLHWAGR